MVCSSFFFIDTATTEIYTLSLHDALPISTTRTTPGGSRSSAWPRSPRFRRSLRRSEEHTSELQSRQYLVCRLLLEKKNIPLNSPSPSRRVTSNVFADHLHVVHSSLIPNAA